MLDFEIRRRKRRIRALAIACVIFAFLIALTLLYYFIPFERLLPAYAISPRKEGELRIHFLDVGQGDCTIVEFPDGELLVIDAGDGSWEANVSVIRYLKGLNADEPALLITHADLDHYGGISQILRCFGATQLYLPVVSSSAAAYTEMLSQAEKIGCPTSVMKRYGVISHSSGAYLVCLSPYSQETDENDSSAVLWLDYGGVSALFSGDVSKAREEKLLEEYRADKDIFNSGEFRVSLSETEILKVAHHGSADAVSEEWLNLLHFETAVISCGADNYYSHPSGEALSALAAASPGCGIYRTDELGNIVIAISDGNYSVL